MRSMVGLFWGLFRNQNKVRLTRATHSNVFWMKSGEIVGWVGPGNRFSVLTVPTSRDLFPRSDKWHYRPRLLVVHWDLLMVNLVSSCWSTVQVCGWVNHKQGRQCPDESAQKNPAVAAAPIGSAHHHRLDCSHMVTFSFLEVFQGGRLLPATFIRFFEAI
jgi:hypothetical protein